MQESRNKTDIVLLAAGLSRRMGKINKMLLPVNGMSMCAHCAMKAIDYLESLPEGGNLIVVTGYRSRELVKSLAPCIERVSKAACAVTLTIVRNPGYREGQFSSAKTGVFNVREGAQFFIALADMPDITSDNYRALSPLLGSCDAVRPFVNGQPGHPVLHSPLLKEKILAMKNSASVHELLSSCNTLNVDVEGSSWIRDIDSSESYITIQEQENR